MVALVAGGRGGTKIFQSYLDNHPGILMIPGYPLMYLYPHWATWTAEAGQDFTWEQAINLFCEKHASVLDSRRVPGLTGMVGLGERRDEHTGVNEEEFRAHMGALLHGQPVSRRTFLLAVHYAYALCKGWDLQSKSVLLLHLHYAPYLRELAADFPGLGVFFMLRDPRTSLPSTLRALGYVDQDKLNATDGMIFRREKTTGSPANLSWKPWTCCRTALVGLPLAHSGWSPSENTTNLPCEASLNGWMWISPESMLGSTFEGKLWWGDVTNEVRVNGLDRQSEAEPWRKSINKIDTFVTEGASFNYFSKYGYQLSEYRRDSALNKLLLALAVLIPSKAELQTCGIYLNPLTHLRFLRAAVAESTGQAPRKDYTWNGTYRYKYTYIDLKLWRLRWHQRLLNLAERLTQVSNHRWAAGLLTPTGRGAYVAGQYVRFWLATITFPQQIVRRWGIYYRSIWRRLSGRNYLPHLLTDAQ